MTYAILISRNDYHSLTTHQFRVEINQLHYRIHFFFDTHLCESNNTPVRQPSNEYQFTKIFILSNEYATFFRRKGEYFFIWGARSHI